MFNEAKWQDETWRRIPSFERLKEEFTPPKAEQVKANLDEKARKAITIKGRMDLVNACNYILYLEQLLQRKGSILNSKKRRPFRRLPEDDVRELANRRNAL